MDVVALIPPPTRLGVLVPGYILISHPVHSAIGHEEMRAALPEAGATCVPVRLEPARLSLGETESLDWEGLRRTQARLVSEKLEPLLRENPTFELAYFGLAPIPLAVHLGFLVSRWRPTRVYLRNHSTYDWNWPTDSPAAPCSCATRGLPGDVVHSNADVIVRVSVTARVDAKTTSQLVPSASAEIDIEVEAPGEDVVNSLADVEHIALQFKTVLDRLETHRPDARRIHLFASVPVGVAYRLGSVISETRHLPVQTYQYLRHKTPPHQEAILLHDAQRRTRAVATNEREAAGRLREEWAAELARLEQFGRDLSGRFSDGPWYETLPEARERFSGDPSWRRLARIWETPIGITASPLVAGADEDEFHYEESRRTWFLSDPLVRAIGARLGPSRALRAGRLLLMHESIHIATHRLTESTAPAIRRFPKILEHADYQADVWAMVHELAMTLEGAGAVAEAAPQLALDILDDAIETMWAFDDDESGRLDRMEVRRVNRYLIWYWQRLRLERCRTLSEVLAVLASKPFVELAGPRMRSDGDRVQYQLYSPHHSALEICVLHEVTGAISRHGETGALNLTRLLEGLSRLSGGSVRGVLKGIMDQEIGRS